MRFIVMHKVDANMEAGGPPSPDIIRDMGALVQGSLKDGTFLNGAGLHRSAKRVRVTCRAGETSVRSGPYAGENELVASVVMVRTKSFDEAVEIAKRITEASGSDAEIEVGPVVEPWDLGMIEKPTHEVPQRSLLVIKGDAGSERGDPSSAGHSAALKELRSTDQVLAEYTLAPSSKGSRAAPSKGKASPTWVDGPFTESKELIAGFSILSLPSKQDALAWADRYAAILTMSEVDVRELLEP